MIHGLVAAGPKRMRNIRKDSSQHRTTLDVCSRVASSQFHQLLQAVQVHANFTEKTGDDLGCQDS